VASTKNYNGFIYLCELDNIRPLQAIDIPANLHVTYMTMSQHKNADVLVIGYDNGDIQLVFDMNFAQRMSVKYHDAHSGSITQVAFNHDDTFFLTAAADGLIFAHQFDRRAAAEENKFDPLGNVEGAAFLPEDEKKEMKEKKLKEYHD
jgi:WD40 repeat protein